MLAFLLISNLEVGRGRSLVVLLEGDDGGSRSFQDVVLVLYVVVVGSNVEVSVSDDYVRLDRFTCVDLRLNRIDGRLVAFQVQVLGKDGERGSGLDTRVVDLVGIDVYLGCSFSGIDIVEELQGIVGFVLYLINKVYIDTVDLDNVLDDDFGFYPSAIVYLVGNSLYGDEFDVTLGDIEVLVECRGVVVLTRDVCLCSTCKDIILVGDGEVPAFLQFLCLHRII